MKMTVITSTIKTALLVTLLTLGAQSALAGEGDVVFHGSSCETLFPDQNVQKSHAGFRNAGSTTVYATCPIDLGNKLEIIGGIITHDPGTRCYVGRKSISGAVEWSFASPNSKSYGSAMKSMFRPNYRDSFMLWCSVPAGEFIQSYWVNTRLVN